MTGLFPHPEVRPESVSVAAIDLHMIAVTEAYQMVALYLNRLNHLLENPSAVSWPAGDPADAGQIRGWSRAVHYSVHDGEWQVYTIAPADRVGDDPTGLYPQIDQMRRDAAHCDEPF